MDLFTPINNDSDDHATSEAHNNEGESLKKRKITLNQSSSDSQSDFSDWEDVPLTSSEIPESFNISINSNYAPDVDESRKRKLKEAIRNKKRRTSIHSMGMISYSLHAYQRNRWLNSKTLLKRLKKLLPDSLLNGRFKKYKRSMKSFLKTPSDEALKNAAYSNFMYIIKYLIKWFRLNYKLDSNGLRILGYLPRREKSTVDKNDYFPNTSSPINSLQDFLSISKKFRHNRDTGAQIFTALLRSLGFQSRLVFSLPLLSTSNNIKLQPQLDHDKLKRNKDHDLLYPYFWTELVSPIDESEIYVIETICFQDESKMLLPLNRFTRSTLTKEDLNRFYTDNFYPIRNQFNQMSMHYVVSLDNNNLAMDVSSRYMPDISYRWFDKLDQRTDLGRMALLFRLILGILNAKCEYNSFINLELSSLKQVALLNYRIPSTFAEMKRNPNLVTLSTLRYNEVIRSNSIPIGSIEINDKFGKESIFVKTTLIVGRSVQQWKILGRSIIEDQIDCPIKIIKSIRPRTIMKRRLFNLNVLNGEPELNKVKLYSFDQTCPYINMKVSILDNGKVMLPRNEYGNIEIFKPSMVPDLCSWLTLSNIENILFDYKTGKLKLKFNDKVEYVSVINGFNFLSNPGKATPIKCGVIVLKLQEDLAKKIWLHGKIRLSEKYINEQRMRVLYTWNDLMKRLRIRSMVEENYGSDGD